LRENDLKKRANIMEMTVSPWKDADPGQPEVEDEKAR
jgi:hypothetical protein